jgi:hypothetical protein
LEFALSEAGVDLLKEKNVLFIVKKKPRLQSSLIDLIEVVRMTNDEDIIHRYHQMGDNYTPIRVGLLV